MGKNRASGRLNTEDVSRLLSQWNTVRLLHSPHGVCLTQDIKNGVLKVDRRAESEGCYFDAVAAQKAIDFIERFCVHWKGATAKRHFRLLDWEKLIVYSLFGWKKSDGLRRFRTAYIEIPRKNGKSTLAAAIALMMLVADDEDGASVVSCAANESQARCVWENAANMVGASPLLQRVIERFRSQLRYKRRNGTYEVVSAIAETKHGRDDSCVVFDEVHAQRTDELWNVMTSGVGSRRQPLIFAITTAGDDLESIARRLHDYAVGVLQGVIDDISFFPFLAGAPDDMDWWRLETWIRANPSLNLVNMLDYDVVADSGLTSLQNVRIKPEYGVPDVDEPKAYLTELRRWSIKNKFSKHTPLQLEYLIDEATQALHSESAKARFLWLNLNRWMQQKARMIDETAWRQCKSDFDSNVPGRVWYGGLDVAAKRDINAFVLVSPPPTVDDFYMIDCWFWVPQGTIHERVQNDYVPYDLWAHDGFLRTLPGEIIDLDAMVSEIIQICESRKVHSVGFDPWNATYIATKLMNAGISVVEVPQTVRHFSDPSKTLIDLVKSRKIKHKGNLVMNWMLSNCVARIDTNGNIRPDKRMSREKIDGVIALLMALGRSLTDVENVSVEPGIFII